MSRRTRTAALLSATTLLLGGSLSLGLAPAASADTPPLDGFTINIGSPAIGDNIFASGNGCPNLPSSPVSNSAGGQDEGPAGPSDGGAASEATAGASTIDLTITIPNQGGVGGTTSTTKGAAIPNADGVWTTNSPITIQASGEYILKATCNIDSAGNFDYPDTIEFTVAPQAIQPKPVVTPGEGQTVAPGGKVTVSGVDFVGATSVDVSLDGYPAVTGVPVTDGGFSGVAFTMSPTQGSATLKGTITPTGGGLTPVDYSVVVVAPTPTSTPTPPSADGTVPTGGGNSNVGSGTTTTTNRGYTASKPTLPNTGTDTVWPGVIGGLLVLSGAGLLWAGRRREAAGTAAV